MVMPAVDCDVVILAGGLGTRLRSVVGNVPKPMADVAGRPFLAHLLTRLISVGVKRVVLSVGHLGEMVEDYFGDNFQGVTIIYSREQTPLGTGGAIVAAVQYCQSADAIVLNGDTFADLDYVAFLKYCRDQNAPLGIAVREVSDTNRYGRCEIDAGRLSKFSEKGLAGPGLINAGIYYIGGGLFDKCPAPSQKFSFEEDFIAANLASIGPAGFVSDGYFIDIGVPEDYAQAQLDFASGVGRSQAVSS